MNKRFFNFVIHLPFLLHFVIFNSLNTGNFVLSCKGSVRTGKNLEEIRLGKNLQIFKTYKKRPSSDAPQENRQRQNADAGQSRDQPWQYSSQHYSE